MKKKTYDIASASGCGEAKRARVHDTRIVGELFRNKFLEASAKNTFTEYVPADKLLDDFVIWLNI